MKMRKTKIICTLGPATDDEKILRELVLNGMNVARLNFSHGTHQEHLIRANMVKKVREELKLPVALMLDTKGPEIRIKKFAKGKVVLKEDSIFTLTTNDVEGDENIVAVTYSGLPEDVNIKDKILIDDGLIEMVVKEKNETDIKCKVINGGEVSDNKGVNIPGVEINLPYVSEKDKQDLLFAVNNDFDFIAASFVRNSADVKELQKILFENDATEIKIISKIENRSGVDEIEDIIRNSDGIMVARGDMGVEIPFKELPALQKSLIKKSYLAGKPVITATQMLDSMIRNPRPTRAEITDVANAIYDGTSALMLSGEISIGKYPVETLKTMSEITVETENDIDYIKRFNDAHIVLSTNVTNAISHATCQTAHSLRASAIISVTKSGHTARMVSKFRPACPIISTTTSNRVYRQLALSWGVYPILTATKNTTDDIFEQSIDKAQESGIVINGDLVVITGGMPVGVSGTTNTLKVHIIGDVLVKGKGLNNFKASHNVCVAKTEEAAIEQFNSGDILVISKTFKSILPMIKNASALVTEENEKDSKAVTVALAMEIPVITEASNATEILKSGTVVTADASDGLIHSVNAALSE